MSNTAERKKDIKRLKIRKCQYCDSNFKVNREWQKFCSPQCRYKQWDIDNPRIKNEKEKT
jgi:hypothetical protein